MNLNEKKISTRRKDSETECMNGAVEEVRGFFIT